MLIKFLKKLWRSVEMGADKQGYIQMYIAGAITQEEFLLQMERIEKEYGTKE